MARALAFSISSVLSKNSLLCKGCRSFCLVAACWNRELLGSCVVIDFFSGFSLGTQIRFDSGVEASFPNTSLYAENPDP